MVERRPEEPRVGGPIPPRSTDEKDVKLHGS